MSDATKLPLEQQDAAFKSISAEGLPLAIERQAAAGVPSHAMCTHKHACIPTCTVQGAASSDELHGLIRLFLSRPHQGCGRVKPA